MSTHLPLDPTDPNLGGIPLDDFPEFVRLMTAKHGKSPMVYDDDGRLVGIFDDPYPVTIPPEIAARLKTLGAMVVPHTPGHRDLLDLIQRLAPESAEPLLMPPSLTIPTRVHRDDHPSTRARTPAETWPGQREHHRHHDLMVAEHATTGVYRDPVSGRVFPPGQSMKRDPNRRERRRLEVWRRTGKAPR